MNRILIILSLVILACVAVGGVATRGASGAASTGGQFLTHCGFFPTYQRAQVDPIVSHGQPVSAHLHDFFGLVNVVNENTKANTTLDPNPNNPDDPGYSPASSSCHGYGDWPAYWYPTEKLGDGKFYPVNHSDGALAPNTNLINTWKSPIGSIVGAPPYGMSYVAGDSHATSQATESPNVAWSCGSLSPTYRKPQNCNGKDLGLVTGIVTFPNCWNGQHGWGADGWDGSVAQPVQFDGAAGIDPSDFAYGTPCPTGFHAIVQLVTRETFTDNNGGPLKNALNGAGQVRLSFSSGGWYSYHGDFLNLWNVGIKQLVDACLNTPGGAATAFCTDPQR